MDKRVLAHVEVGDACMIAMMAYNADEAARQGEQGQKTMLADQCVMDEVGLELPFLRVSGGKSVSRLLFKKSRPESTLSCLRRSALLVLYFRAPSDRQAYMNEHSAAIAVRLW